MLIVQNVNMNGPQSHINLSIFSRLQLDMRNLSLGRRHLVNAYEVKAGIGVIAGYTV